MVFKPGHNDTPGRRRILTDALRRELARKVRQGGPDAATRIARKAVEAAEAGEPWAQSLVFDRIEGKPSQALTIAGDPENETPVQLNIVGK